MSDANTDTTPRARRRLQFGLRWLPLPALLVALLFGTNGFGIIGIRYPRPIENDPLLAPVKVLSVRNDCLYLADGRILHVQRMLNDDPLSDLLRASDGQVDMERCGDKGFTLFVKARGRICGRARGGVDIPLVPVDVPINRRVRLLYATEIANGNTRNRTDLSHETPR